jgi:hypothetical protein
MQNDERFRPGRWFIGWMRLPAVGELFRVVALVLAEIRVETGWMAASMEDQSSKTGYLFGAPAARRNWRLCRSTSKIDAMVFVGGLADC